jgi:hypothetical protein
MLPEQAIDEYIEIYRKKFGITLSREEAEFRANRLVNLYKAVLCVELHQVSNIEKPISNE